MSMRSAVLAASAVGLLLTAGGAARAQAAKPESAKPESAEAVAAAAAMERAQRMAANPLKVILQASKIRRRLDADPAPEPVRAALRTVVASAAVVAPAAVAALATSRGAPAAAPTAAVVRVAPLAPASAPVETVVFEPPAATSAAAAVAAATFAPPPAQADPTPEPAAASVVTPAAKSTTLAAATLAITAPTTAAAAAAPVAVQPKLVTMIEPDIPARLLIEGPRGVEIFADLALRVDGSVGSVTLLPGVPRPWQRYVTVALERWRFEPLPAARVHRVQLVFAE